MSEVRSVTTSEEQDTPTFPYLLAQETTIASICFQTNKLFIDKDQSVQSIQSSDTELIQSRLKSCVIMNNYINQQEQGIAIETIAQSQHYYCSKNMDLSEGKNISQKNQLLNENRQEQQKRQIAKQNIKEQAPILPQTDKSQRNPEKEASNKNKNKSFFTKKTRNFKDNEDQAFWKYIIHDNDPKMKRTIIKPCRFWMGQHVKYCKNSRIIKRVRREICQITIHLFDHSAILSSNTNIMTENITKGSIIIKPNSKVRLSPQQIIIMTIDKEYSFELSENNLMILAKKGQNRICLQKAKGHTMQNTLNVACAIDVKIYLNV